MSVSAEAASHEPPRPSLATAPAHSQPHLYGRAFWCTYIANTALMVAISLMYRYADFVLYLGGNELSVGWIVGTGMVGSLVMRFFQGYGIDHFGPRRIWLSSVALCVVSLLAHTAITSAYSPPIYLARIAYMTGVAGAFGASITAVSRSLPLGRMTEVIGSLGTSGFIAMALGPQLGDYFCGGSQITRSDLDQMFCVAAALCLVSLGCAAIATRGEAPPRRRKRPGVAWLLRRYHPGSVMAMGVVMGIGFVLPNTFLPTYVKELNIPRTGSFFLVYAVTAFLARLSTRRMAMTLGVRPMAFLGLAALVVSLFAYLPVTNEWWLAVPGVFAGISHALLFPAVTAQGSSAFPNRYRGLGTTVMLAMLDVGMLVGAPLIGAIVDYSPEANLPPYPTMFLTIAALVTLTGVFYAFTERR